MHEQLLFLAQGAPAPAAAAPAPAAVPSSAPVASPPAGQVQGTAVQGIPGPGDRPPPPTSGDPLGSMMVPLILFFVIFYFLLIRPQQKRQKEHERMVSALKVGDRVVTSAGIHGFVANLKERTVVIKVADNVRMEFDRSAVTAVIRPPSEPEKKKT